MRLVDLEKTKLVQLFDLFLLEQVRENDPDAGTRTIFASDLAKALMSMVPSEDVFDKFDIEMAANMTKVGKSDKLLIGTTEGGKAISMNDFYWSLLNAILPGEIHKCYYRGKNLGNGPNGAQREAIVNGTFDDIFLGDYWFAGNEYWVIMDFDNLLNTYPLTKPHYLCIMPAHTLALGPMNSSDTNSAGYAGSNFRTGANGNTILQQLKTIINPIFPENQRYKHSEYMANSVTSTGSISGTVELEIDIDPPTETMFFGHNVNSLEKFRIGDSGLLSLVSVVGLNYAIGNHANQTGFVMRNPVATTSFAYCNAGPTSIHASVQTINHRPVIYYKG